MFSIDYFTKLFTSKSLVYQRTDKTGYINLANNEFWHYKLDDFFQEVILKPIESRILASYPFVPMYERLLEEYLNIPEKSAILCPGSDFAIHVVLDAFGHRADKIIIDHPNYDGYQYYCRLKKLTFEKAIASCGFSVKDKDYLCKIAENEKNSILCITNPSGVKNFFLDRMDIIKIIEKSLKHNNIVVIDEAYTLFMQEAYHNLISKYKNLILIRSFSKCFGMAGIRIGCLLCNYSLAEYLRGWNSGSAVSSIALAGLGAILKNNLFFQQIRNDIISFRSRMSKLLASHASGFSVIEGCGPFIFVCLKSPLQVRYICQKLAEQKILVKNLEKIDPSLAGTLRISVQLFKDAEAVFHTIGKCISSVSNEEKRQ